MENRHTAEDLKFMQALPLSMKELLSGDRIRDFIRTYTEEGVIVYRSGGKDSDVLGHMVLRLYPNVKQVFCNTGLESESVRKHGMEIADKVLYPSMNFVEVITKYGYPVISKEVAQKISDCRSAMKHGKRSYVMDQFEGSYVSKNGKSNMIDIKKWKFLLDAPFRISNKCCDISKKNPSKRYEKETGVHPFIATLADESMLRYKKWITYGCNAYDADRITSNPLSFWTEQDILQYIKKYNLKIADAYGEIVPDYERVGQINGQLNLFGEDEYPLKCSKANRTGCVFCMFGIGYDTKRFLRLKEDEPKKYDFVMRGGKFDDEGMWVPDNGLGYRFVIDWLNEHGDLKIEY